MQTMHVKAGSRIFAAGEPSNAVYIIERGTILISSGDPRAPAPIARLGPGELFGESGVLEKRARSANATALTDADLLITPADTFLTAFGMNNAPALALVKMICRRLRDTTQRASRPRPENTAGSPVGATVLLAPDPALAAMYALAAVEIRHLPFEVGNRMGGGDAPIASNHSLAIPAHGRLDLGAPHFEISRRGGIIGVRDMGTAKGTLVNGKTLGRGAMEAFTELHDGENTVIAGGAESAFRFRAYLLPGPIFCLG
jgi:hypothetical protein